MIESTIMMIGTTYSPRHIAYFGLDQQESLYRLTEFGFDCIRLCAYWSDSERRKGEYDFTSIHRVLGVLEKKKITVILTVGMKSPGWPEFHLPVWVNRRDSVHRIYEQARNYLQNLITETRRYDCITHWQVENEPLDPLFPSNLIIPLTVLEDEIRMLKQYGGHRRIISTVFANDPRRQHAVSILSGISDIIGIDVYYRVPLIGPVYVGPFGGNPAIRTLIRKCPKPVWITELQASPWEKREASNLSPGQQGITPQRIGQYFRQAGELPVEAIFFWGFEYWLWKDLHTGDNWYGYIRHLLHRD